MTNQTIELRNVNVELVGSETDGSLFVSGYVNKTGQWSQPLGNKKKFVEKIEPGTFKRALEQSNEVNFLAEHDNAKLLASTKNGSLVLREDDQGLYMEATISDTTWGRDYHTLIEDGLLTNMSFGMQVLGNTWSKRNDGTLQRTVNEILLSEVSVVKNPAYVQSNIQARSIDIVNEIEIPNMKERNLNDMDIKQLQELKTKIFNENRELLMKESRSLSDGEQYCQSEVLDELRSIDGKIQSVEYTNKTETRGAITMNKNNGLEKETRAVEQFLRKQDGPELREVRAVTTGTTPGSLTVPTTISDYIVEKLYESAPIFSRTKNFTPVNGFLEILREKTLGTASFVGEMNQSNMANDFTMDKVRLDQKRVGSAIELSEHLVNDSGIDVVNYSIGVLSRRLGTKLDETVLNGDKTKGEFEGILNDVTIEDMISASSTDITIDELLDLYNSMNPSYIGGAVWVMSRPTFNKISKLKNTNGDYHLVRDVATTGPIYKLFGQPVLIQNVMPAPVAGERAVLFANFGEGYATMTKKGLTLKHISDDTTQALRGSHLLLLDGYMDGKVLNKDAIKALKMK
ncbi:phage major capsid protein [Bacillus mycoides]|uniref:phage major capsid protein n=1 Tax=Bacillus mycoides TaxID=1405 RepID=UPI001C0221AD|nr:phage major capsid protein [Bacillus mycoides]QWH10415.1 phage major capsid protein [Bacillus mycoides]